MVFVLVVLFGGFLLVVFFFLLPLFLRSGGCNSSEGFPYSRHYGLSGPIGDFSCIGYNLAVITQYPAQWSPCPGAYLCRGHPGQQPWALLLEGVAK